MLRLTEIKTGRLLFVGEDENLASFDPHLYATIRGGYGKHNVGTVAQYLDAKGWELDMGEFGLTEEDRKYIEAHKNKPPVSERKYSE
jgi:hypothetical protein